MKIGYQHNLAQQEVYGRINNFLTDLQKQHSDKISNFQITWDSEHTRADCSVEVMGFKTKGQVILNDGQVSLEGKPPFVVKMFSGKIEEMVRTQLDDLLS